MENVRLVIWDLDQTFWRGTLTEGGIELIPELIETVITLAKRGIVSSICSKNDMEPVQKILSDAGVWQYFVFPSINWLPKGPRVAQIIEDIQLRAPTVLFIDDNPSNLNEVLTFVPGIQVANEDIVFDILDMPAFKGKSDPNLERLNQYKLLEKRQSDAKSHASDLDDFLRESHIRVTVDHDLTQNIDRAIELINRTNQLNYTKLRLPDDIVAARAQFKELLTRFDVNAGLLRVSDDYGDHGFCGLYVTEFGGRNLVHFCFSCRILGMGIETWLYNRLNRPHLRIVGDVLHNVLEDARRVDWVHVAGDIAATSDGGEEAKVGLDTVIARGGCDLGAVTHYFRTSSVDVHTEFSLSRETFELRTDHTLLLAATARDQVNASLHAFQLLGFQIEDFNTRIFEPAERRTLRIWSFWADAFCPLYRHVTSGVLVPFPLRTPSGSCQDDARGMSREDLQENLRNTWVANALEVLKSEFEYVGLIDEETFKHNFRAVLSRIPEDGMTVVLLPAEKIQNLEKSGYYSHPMCINLNTWARDVAREYRHAKLYTMREFLSNETDMTNIFHFERMVYVRVFREISNYALESAFSNKIM